MGTFICSISERDWIIARIKGIYGNKEGNIRRDGTYHEFSPSTKYSIIRDLVGMKKGDNVFFHVLTNYGPSKVYGIYIVREEPFYDNTKVWNDSQEIFPYRFLFEPHPKYVYLCNKGANIEVVDFYELIEQRKIWTLATLENERNIEARSVRKIESVKETKEILRLLHRDFRQRHDKVKIKFCPISLTRNYEYLDTYIQDIGKYENSIKALLMYKLKKNDISITNILGPVHDFMNEVFIAQTTRKSIDILCIQNNEHNFKRYTICEVKTDKCQPDSLMQVLYYVDLFKRKELVSLWSDKVFGCLVGKRFDTEVLEFSKKRNKQNINGKIILIEYNSYKNGTNAKLRRLA